MKKMKTIAYLCLAGIFFPACTEENKMQTDSGNGFLTEEPLKFLSRNYYSFSLKLSTGNLETAVTNDQTLYDLLKMIRNFKEIGDFKTAQSEIAKDSLLISRNAREDSFLQRFIVAKSERCSIDSYEESLKKSKILEISSKEITNCLILKFCKKGYYVSRSDESGMYIVRQE